MRETFFNKFCCRLSPARNSDKIPIRELTLELPKEPKITN